MQLLCLVVLVTLIALNTKANPPSSHNPRSPPFDRTVSRNLFLQLEELSRLVAISYCVGNTGIQEPFECLSHCSDFKGFALVTTWSTGILQSSSSGYIALSHPPWPQRILVVFRGTHSFTDAINDLMTSPAEYLPYSSNDTHCRNCTVHSGFMASWNATKEQILPTLERLKLEYPEYHLVLTGHSLGGAMAALAAVDFKVRGWNVKVTTFGEPRVGNRAMAEYMDSIFPWNVSESSMKYHRVTHVHDPVPLLPFEDWGWRMHGGEVYISKDGLPPDVGDLERCEGDEDDNCIQGPASSRSDTARNLLQSQKLLSQTPAKDSDLGLKKPAPWELWQLLFAHREYFWRIGLCFDPQWRDYPRDGDDAFEPGTLQ